MCSDLGMFKYSDQTGSPLTLCLFNVLFMVHVYSALKGFFFFFFFFYSSCFTSFSSQSLSLCHSVSVCLSVCLSLSLSLSLFSVCVERREGGSEVGE